MRFILLLLLCLSAPVSHANGLLDKLSGFGSQPQQPAFLPPDQAFAVEVAVRDAATLQASFSITPGYYLYRDKTHFTVEGGKTRIASVELPQGELKHDPNFGDTQVFHQPFQAIIKLKRDDPSAATLTLNVSYQGCSEQGLCYPSQDKSLQLKLPAASGASPAPAAPQIATQTTSQAAPQTATPADTAATAAAPAAAPAAIAPAQQTENSKIAQLFASGSFWLVISFFFGAGLLLALTPCVFPMIPILSGIIVGHGHKITRTHAFILSLSYVLGMAITYAVAGVAAGLTGDLISSALQTPWVLGSFAAVFVLLSLSMFGFYELQLPSSWQSKLSDTSNRLHGGHLSGVFAMGALSAVIMGPCVAAPLAGALLYISKTHDAVLGGVALFTLALGMGAPLLAIGTSAGALLPRAGAWMDGVKRIFGVLMLALAIWIIQPLLPTPALMLLWSILLIFSAIYLHALETLPAQANGWLRLRKAFGLLALLVGIAYLVGALSGARDLLRPLDSVCASCRAGTQSSSGPQTFTRIRDLAELRQRLADTGGRSVMLDFYADWCTSCKEMERYTFSDPTVQARLNNAIVLQADVTANSAADKELLKTFGLFGPPGILFFDAEGREKSDFRVVGFQDAARFLESLKSAGL